MQHSWSEELAAKTTVCAVGAICSGIFCSRCTMIKAGCRDDLIYSIASLRMSDTDNKLFCYSCEKYSGSKKHHYPTLREIQDSFN